MNILLWTFFKKFNEKSSVKLTLEEYFAFMEAISQTSVSLEDLQSYCQLFWLKDQRDLSIFKDLFEEYFEVHSFLSNLLTDHQGPIPPPIKPKDLSPLNIPPKAIKNPIVFEEKAHIPQKITAEQEEDKRENFELKIAEGFSDKEKDQTKKFKFANDFMMEEEDLLPFRKRFIAQRIRRRANGQERQLSKQIELPKMIEQFCKEGYLGEIAYRVRSKNRPHLVFFADRFGSMLAYEYLEELFLQTFKLIPNCHLEHYFFYNVPFKNPNANHFFLSHATDKRLNLNTAKHPWNKETLFIFLSDAGAHSGIVNVDRIKTTVRFWKFLQQISKHLFWINPFPLEEMNDCTAKRLNLLIPMHYPDELTLGQLFDTQSL